MVQFCNSYVSFLEIYKKSNISMKILVERDDTLQVTEEYIMKVIFIEEGRAKGISKGWWGIL